MAPSDRSAAVEILRIDASGYPAVLRSIPSPPKTLWVRGSLPPATAVAIVGTRKPTRFGRDLAAAAARSALAAGLAVISGLATGVDTVAHEAVLAAGGRTWAVIGSGVDVPTPISNAVLADEIVEAGGGLISEVPPGTPVSVRNLVARDRIQSGLSLAVFVCQCETSSGTMHTARFAAEQGRLLAVARPRGPESAEHANSGNLALVDPDGCDPLLLSARGKTVELVRARRPMADVVIDSSDELAGLWDRILSV
ncbi:MAG: DNA-processing protein DprA [Acidimicrobiales bacterium]